MVRFWIDGLLLLGSAIAVLAGLAGAIFLAEWMEDEHPFFLAVIVGFCVWLGASHIASMR